MGNKKKLIKWGIPMLLLTICLINNTENTVIEASKSYSHIGTFNGSTTFTTSSSNGINPGLFIEVMDNDGNLTQYESEDGVITVPNTKEGTYITQAKLLGKTKYRDIDTGEILETWEEGRNLELVSVENPELLTESSRNLWYNDDSWEPDGIMYVGNYFIPVKPGEKLYFSGSTDYNDIIKYDANKESLGIKQILGWFGNGVGLVGENIYTVEDGVYYIKIKAHKGFLNTLMVNRGNDYLPYEEGKPYKSNLITTDEEITLRGIEEIRDELDLMTGELTQSLTQSAFISAEHITTGTITTFENTIRWQTTSNFRDVMELKTIGKIMSNTLISSDSHEDFEHIRLDGSSPNANIIIYLDKTKAMSHADLHTYLKNNHLTFVAQKKVYDIKTINLTHTYTFPQILNKNISIKGNISPTLGSITVPTEALSFTLNPNLEAGQQFIAPEFSISNKSQAPINLELKSFEQTTDVLNDVSPDKYASWEGLNKEQSKDIALALEPQPSDNWVTLNEDSYYAANVSNIQLGQVKGDSTVDFKFSALHGQSFTETLNPQYKLTFVFEL